MSMAKRKSVAKNSPKRLQKYLRMFARFMLWFFGVSIVWVLLYRVINPPITFLMIQRGVERKMDGKDWQIEKKWLNYKELSSNLKKAAIGGEDATFLSHYGFDLKALENAYETNQKGRRTIGGSTISQQTAKNVFLWPGRSYIRKAFEAYFTVLIELFWGKKRILEVYLNVIETGDGIYGAEAATQRYYRKSARSLSQSQAALLIAVLPNPRRWSPAKPTSYIYRKRDIILRNMWRIKM